MKKIAILFILLSSSWACDDLLDKTDLSGIDERTWDSESTATLYLNRLYDQIMPMYPNMRSVKTVPTALHVVSDESGTGDNRVLYGTVSINNINDFSADSKDNAWFFIRKVNILLTEIVKGSLDDATRNKIMGQAYFLRAWVYFNLVKVYGGVPIITHPQDWTTEDLFVPRQKTLDCIDFIVEDLDKAIAMLQPGMPATQGTDRGRITRDAALAIKGRVLLFWASAQFNPNNDADRWQRAYDANKAAYDSLTAHGYALYSNFGDVLIEEGGNNKEVIMIRSYDGVIAANSFENGARPVSESDGGGGSFHPTWELVKAFPMKDGTPAMVDGVASNGFDTVYYWKDRDPRFYTTIAYNGSIWPLSNQPARKQWTYEGVAEDKSKQTATGFYCRKGVNPRTSKANAKLGSTDWVEMRFAEVMLNLAECANGIGNSEEAYNMLKAIRARAGITPNDDGQYGLEAGMGKDAMLKAIIEERRIEFAFEGKRHDDLRRTRLFHTLNGQQRHALIIKPNNIKTLEAKQNGVMFRETLDLEGPDYTTHFTPTYKTIDSDKKIKFEDFYYFYAIPTQNIDRNPNLLQTMGWNDGTFDPLN